MRFLTLKNPTHIKLAFLLFISTFTLTAQHLNGKVLDRETNTPLENVNIYFEGNKDSGTVTDNNGVFDLQLAKDYHSSDIVVFSMVGYSVLKYTIEDVKSRNYVLFLVKKNEALDEVLVISDLILRPELKYKKVQPLDFGVDYFGSVLVDHKIYVFGGNKTIIEETGRKAMELALDFSEFLKILKLDMTWENYSDKLQVYDVLKDSVYVSDLEFKKRAYHEAVAVNDTVYVLGGKTLSKNQKREYLENNIEVFDLGTKELKLDNAYPHQAVNFAAVSYKDNIIVMGGSTKIKLNKEKVFSDKSYIYNVNSGYWYELANMTSPKEVSGVLVNNRIYLVGGYHNKALKTIEYYDLEKGTWHYEGDLFKGIENAALTQHDNIIYIFNDDTLLTYNTLTTVLNTYKTDLDVFNASLFYADGKLFLVGGTTNYNYTISPASNIYSIDIRELPRTQIMQTKTLN
ncbi:carboxypeptidase-like regulatory domain-containing protein [uncultured Formosa sp.]|uniref:Kelch repeat-containing protein n=1 Tax=uncultured Formosa sp. TaxID=255435 RepID=UPI0026092461|nr:carboxypeptidase-like regulatory domain-containing protein [uncultured Formosa sp.]